MIKGQKKSELILYLVLWAVLFAAPVVSMLVGDFFMSSPMDAEMRGYIVQSSSVDWQNVYNAWGLLSMFCVTFFVHNIFVAPLLVYGNHRKAYGFTVVALTAAFMFYQIACRPHHREAVPDKKPLPEMEMKRAVRPDYSRTFTHGKPDDSNAEGHINPPPLPEKGRKGDRIVEKREPPRAFGGQDSVAFIIMALLLGLNIGAKSFFKSMDDRKRIKDLERENLNSQLEYLKYQINPHFFMNTLNNIHALVDIDPEQAKYTIEVLSKLMRYVLYDGNRTMAPLQKELDFISHYVDLMRIRFTDKVRIAVSLPQSVPDVQVPSLLFITFVENAFKHGVSYRKRSFIEVGVMVDETLGEIVFSCNNSRKNGEEDRRGGVGLQNAKRRLKLIYGNDYVLTSDSSPEEYRLLLRLPTNKHHEND